MSDSGYRRWPLAMAIAWMQVRTWKNSLLRGLSRDAVPAAMSVIFTAISVIGSCLFGLAAFVVTGFGGESEAFHFWLFAGIVGSLTLISTLSGASGEAGDLANARLLQVYPVKRRDLFLLDVAAQLLSPTMIFFLPATLGVAAGVAAAHAQDARWISALLPIPAMLVAVFATGLLLRVIAGLVVIGGRRVREALVVGLSVVFLGLTFLGPAIQDDKLAALGRRIGSTDVIVRFTHAGAAAELATGPGILLALVDLIVLAAWIAGLWLAHEKVTGRILDGETGTSQIVRKKSQRAWGWSPSFLFGPITGAAIADFRAMTRIPTVWIQLLMPGLFGLLIGRSSHGAGNANEAELAAEWTPVMAAFGAQLFFTSPLFSNLFGNDHAGATHYVLAPAPAWRILAGKSLSRLTFACGQVGVFFAAVSYRMGGMELRSLALAFCAWLAGSLWVAAAGAFISIRLPFRMSHGLQREAGNRLLSSIVGQLLVGSVLLPPMAMIIGGRAFRGEPGYVAGIACTALAGAMLWAISAVWCSELWPSWAPRLVEELSEKGT